ncbi:methyltransferase type 11 [Coccomyxa subellipsoidea C-169]|uniref:Methyltransferase type 11 n=1 Tax=Coccomyxa subellipsoidea (strain C-169) TaxID=574566 RepID=I0YQC8_COCSC|nr:methyltransferase type 11 [Coccomyxa subellipsoidea C-169]EIE20597.1 methyltransferase type 11 [Coccomyxa subellipsoidea C-169]|eukprot:XP_005645141.1 methyltransferase type 11 [Coccomyxa subellipsoidea C-169]
MQAVERDLVPDFLIRRGIRYLLSQRVQNAREGGVEEQERRKQAFVDELKSLPIAVQTSIANEQHYEAKYFLLVLGKHLKYSSCLYPSSSSTLDEAEEAMLGLCCERAQLADGQTILELGCGWGSMCLYMAGKFPNSTITAVSNSSTQKALIDERAKERGLSNLTVITADVVEFDTKQKFDRVVSIEMFEHMKNYQALLKNISKWLKPGGHLFVHIFTHKTLAYHFEVKGEDDWMAKYFFTGGTMPSADLLHHFQDDLALQQQWAVNGTHYSRTLEDWLRRQDRQRAQILPIMKKTYGDDQGLRWWVYWRLFYLACSELFNYNGGEEWFVSHYLFKKH